MDLASQKERNTKEVSEDTMQDSKDYNNQLLLTQTKRGEELASMCTTIQKTFKILREEHMKTTTE